MLVICREFILRIPLFYSSILLHKINDHCTNCIWGGQLYGANRKTNASGLLSA